MPPWSPDQGLKEPFPAVFWPWFGGVGFVFDLPTGQIATFSTGRPFPCTRVNRATGTQSSFLSPASRLLALCHPAQKAPCCNNLKGLECCIVSAGQISEQRTRRARIGAAACFLLTGVISASWASRVPAIKDGLHLSDGQFAIALLGLEAGAVIGLQLGGLVVPRTGSRRALSTSLLAFSGALLAPALAPSLLVLAASLFLFAALNSVVDVAMNAQGVAVQRLMGRPVLSGLHAMHSLGGVFGAGAGALAARLGAMPPPHFLACAMVAVVVGLAAWSLLLPSRLDARLPGILCRSRARRWPGESFQPTRGVGAACPLRPRGGLRGRSSPASGIKCTRGNR